MCSPRQSYATRVMPRRRSISARSFGPRFFENHYLVLRVRQVDNNHSWDIEDFLDSKTSYWVTVAPNAEYELELG